MDIDRVGPWIIRILLVAGGIILAAVGQDEWVWICIVALFFVD